EKADARIRGGRLTLEEARTKRTEWRGLVKRGIHPAHQRQIEVGETIAAGANTFELMAGDWLTKKGKGWTERKRARIERTPKREIEPFLVAVRGYGGEPTTKIALLLLLLTFVRSNELRGATWKEFDLDGAEWRIPAERMKMRTAHVVPLSSQAVRLLRELHKL